MSESDKHFLREFLGSAGLMVVVLGMFFTFVYLVWRESPSEEVNSFKVVAEYSGCDVVRFSPPNGAEYAYFLDCGKGR